MTSFEPDLHVANKVRITKQSISTGCLQTVWDMAPDSYAANTIPL